MRRKKTIIQTCVIVFLYASFFLALLNLSVSAKGYYDDVNVSIRVELGIENYLNTIDPSRCTSPSMELQVMSPLQ